MKITINNTLKYGTIGIGISYEFSAPFGKYITISLLLIDIDIIFKKPDGLTGWGRGG